jgi:hypothetical protein
VYKALEEEAKRRDTVPEAVVLQVLLRVVPEDERSHAMVEAARILLRHADEYASTGNFEAAFKRLWVASLVALDAAAASRGEEQPRELADYWRLASSLGGDDVLNGWYAGLAAYLASKEGVGDEGHYKAIRGRIEKMVEAIR